MAKYLKLVLTQCLKKHCIIFLALFSKVFKEKYFYNHFCLKKYILINMFYWVSFKSSPVFFICFGGGPL